MSEALTWGIARKKQEVFDLGWTVKVAGELGETEGEGKPQGIK